MCKFSEFSVTVYYSHGARYFLEGGGGVRAIVPGAEIWALRLLNFRRRSMCHRQGKKGQYLGPWAIN